MNKMAEEEFAPLGISPTYAFLMMTVEQRPGITQTDLSDVLHIARSTTTRLVDKLEVKKLVERKSEGKLTLIFPTEKGLDMQPQIKACWESLDRRYEGILGENRGIQLTADIHAASNDLDLKS